MKEKVVKSTEGQQINVLTGSQIIKLTGKETNGQFASIIQNLPPGTGVPRHIHNSNDEHFHILAGEVHFEFGDDESTLKAGDMIFLPRNIPHSIRSVGDQTAVIALTVTPAGAENMFMELSELPAGAPNFEKVSEICGKYGISFL